MTRVALLVGVSQYGKGLEPLPDARKDVEALQQLLQQPRFQFAVEYLCDRPLPEMQEDIEQFFRERASDDQIVFLFCGYTLRDAEGRLYFATPSTTFDEAGTIVKAQVISASVLQEAMNRSPAKQQVLILDTYDQPVSNQPTDAKPSSDLPTQLGGDGRVILAASNSDRPYPTPGAIDAWTYTRYLVDGIESGAADTDDDGRLTAANLHDYATQKLRVAAPGLTPQLYGSTETAQIPLFEVPHNEPQVHYRKVLESAAIAATVDAAGLPMLEGRSLLNDVRHSLGVSPPNAAALEAAVLRPTQDYRQRLEFYQKQVADYAQSHDVASPSTRQALRQLQQALCLTDHDVAMQTIAPSLAVQQRQQAHYQENLTQYQQVLLGAMQRQSPLREGDRVMLQRLQQTLGLEDDDVRAAEAQIATQAEQFLGSESTDLPTTEIAAPSVKTVIQPSTIQPSTARSPEPTAASAEPPPLKAAGNGSLDDSRAKEVVLQRLFNMSEPSRSSHSEPLSSPEAAPTPPSAPVREASPPVLSTTQSTMDRMRRSASNYQALLVPAILLAAIIGLVAAVLSSGNRPDWFKPSWLNFGQTPPDPAAAQRFKSDGLRKAREGFDKEAIDDYNQAIQKNPSDATTYINRGIARHKLGDPGAAIQDYEQALKLEPNSALSRSNLSYAYYDRQDYDKALESGNQAVALDGRLAQAHINLANARAKKGDTVNALRDYTQAIALKPAAEVQAGAFNNRGNVQLGLNKMSEAIRDYGQALRLKPDYADAYYNLGLARQAQGNRPAASRSFQRAADYYQQQNKPELQKAANDRAIALQKGK